MMKRLLTLILALILIAGAAVIPAAALEDEAEAPTDAVADEPVTAPSAPDETAAETIISSAVSDTPAVQDAPAEQAAPAVTEAAGADEDAPVIVEETSEDAPALSTAETDLARIGANYPEMKPTEAVAAGIRVKWKAYPGAAKYRVFLKNGSSWKKLADTTALYYDHTSIKLDTYYTYTVRALDKKGAFCSSYDKYGAPGYKETPPTINKIENIAGGVKVTFTRPKKNSNYSGSLFQSTSNCVELFVTGGTYGNKWYHLATGGTSEVRGAIDAKNSNTTLKFALRMSCAQYYYTSVYSASKSALYIATPTMKVTTVSGAQQITVNKVKGASKYRVFLKNGSSWKKLGDTTSTYTNKNVKYGTCYVYTVRAINASGKYISGYVSSGFPAYYSKTPVVKVEPNEYGLTVSWSKTAASGDYYRVFRKGPKDTSWKAIAEVDGLSYIDYNINPCEKYTYTVRCFNAYNYYTSWHDTVGVTGIYYGVPRVVYGENSEEGVTLAWTTIEGVAAYRLFVRLNNQWKAVGDTKEDYLTYTGAAEGETYRFTVRGLNAQGKYCTAFDSDGFYVTYYKDQEKTFDLDRIKTRMNYAVMAYGNGTFTYNENILDDDEAIAILILYTGFYGPNTGDVTDQLIYIGRQTVESIRLWHDEEGSWYYCWYWVEDDGDYLGYLIIKEV